MVESGTGSKGGKELLNESMSAKDVWIDDIMTDRSKHKYTATILAITHPHAHLNTHRLHSYIS